MEIPIEHNNIDWLIIVDDYDYVEEQAETGPTYASGGEPGYPELIELNEYHLELDPDVVSTNLLNLVNKQLMESNKLCEHIFDLYDERIQELALELYHNIYDDYLDF